MARRTPPTSQSGTGFLRQFATLSLLVMGLMCVGLALVLSHYIRKDVQEQEWRFTAEYVRTEALYRLTPEDFAAPMTSQTQEKFRMLHQRTVMMPDIARIKMYDAGSAIIWSQEPRLIGERFPDNPHLVRALSGRIILNPEIRREGENIYEPDDIDRLVEVFVPIVFLGTSRVAGVVETYTLPQQAFFTPRSRLIAGGAALAGSVILFLSLFWIVHNAARRIESQGALTARLQTAREEERARVAREIHDDLSQPMTALQMELAWWTARLPAEPQALRETAQRLLTLVNTTVRATRRIFTELRPAILDDLGLVAALEWQAQDFQARTGIQCQFNSDESRLVLDPELSTALFRICQKALTNVARHARATRASIRLDKQENELLLTVEDNGKGITDREIADPRSLGLVEMREWVLRLGGRVTFWGAPARGTTVTVRVPLRRPSAEERGDSGPRPFASREGQGADTP